MIGLSAARRRDFRPQPALYLYPEKTDAISLLITITATALNTYLWFGLFSSLGVSYNRVSAIVSRVAVLVKNTPAICVSVMANAWVNHLPSTYRAWLITSLLFAITAVQLFPDYSIQESYFKTALTIFFVQYLVYGVYSVVVYPRYLSPLRHLPQPNGNSFFNGQWAYMMREPSGVPARKWINEIPNDGLIRYLHLFNRERLLVTSPKALSEVLVTKSYEFVKPEFLRSRIGRILGNGILFAEGDDHKKQRRNLLPAFNFRHIKELYPIFWEKSREMVRKVEDESKKSDGAAIEMGDWASRATLDIIGVAGLGQDFNSIADPDTELNRVYRGIFSPSKTARILGLLQFFLPSWFIQNLPVKYNENFSAAVKLARDTSRQLVRAKRDKLERKEKSSPDIISIALESGGFSEDSLVDNMMTFLAAGHETTAASFSWAIYLLCKYPDIKKRLRNEIRAHIGQLDDNIGHAQIDGMPYLHAICQEVLRFYAPVPLTLRDTSVDTTILGQFVPKGTKVVICPWAINFSKEFWGEDADEFKPDRWMAPGQAGSGGATSNFAFLTFLAGEHSCLGARFASAEFACLLATFVGHFEFNLANPDEKLEIGGGITARPRNGVRINVRVLEGW